MRSRRRGATAPAARAPSGGRLCFISVRPINTCSAPFGGLIPLFSFCADSLQDRNKWWRQFWRRVSDYQPVLMRRRDGRQRCHRSCEVLSSNVSARAQCIHLRLLNEGMTCLPRPRRPATPGKRVQALGPRRSLLALRSLQQSYCAVAVSAARMAATTDSGRRSRRPMACIEFVFDA
jgi:hypothetical protein